MIRANNLNIFKASKHPAEAFSYIAHLMQEEPNYQYAQKMAYVMPLLATQKREFYQQSEEWKVALQQTTQPDNTWQVFFPGYNESAAKLAAELQLAYLGSKTPEQALVDGEKAATEALKSFNA